jgi:flagellar assembly factor FliW
MKIKSRSFGELEFEDDAIVSFPEGIIGFEKLKKWVLIENQSMEPFKWIQSVEDGNIALMVIDPHLIRNNYKMAIPSIEHKKIGLETLEKRGDWISFCVIVPKEDIRNSIVNLKAPILINLKEKIGKQIILLNDDYDVEEKFFSEETVRIQREQEKE